MDSTIFCYVCDKPLSCRSVLKRHLSRIHNINEGGEPRKRTSRRICHACEASFQTDEKLRVHLQNIHNINVEYEELEFKSVVDFESWLYSIQNETSSQYSKDSSTKLQSNGFKKTYFYCSRSNTSRIKQERKRNLKSKQSKKIGKTCPSKMEVLQTTTEDGETVFVKFWKTHCGHINDLGHITLGQRERREIAEKLDAGVSFTKVINDVRSGKVVNASHRMKLIDRQDLHNIVRDFNLTYSTKRHENDAISVKLWVEEMETLGEENPVLLYKAQGEASGVLTEHDFMLVIMTSFQTLQLKKFGQDKICVDGTHGTNSYNIQLFTVLAIDEYGSGCPVGFCFSNRQDEDMLKLFFSSIKEKVGVVKSKVFMSDDAPAFFNAWASVMGGPEHKLLCSWHVDKCWQKNLSKISGNKEKKSLVYKTIKTLMEMTSTEEDFKDKLNQTVSNLIKDKDTESFGEYFLKFYASRPQSWAYCFRKGLGLNTNNHLESFHRNLKYIYLDGKKVKRLDKSINAVMNVARDSLFKRLIKLTKESPNSQNSKIQKSHKMSESIGPELITIVTAGIEWSVKSSEKGNEYMVTKAQETCSEPCLNCKSCQICIHAYKCSCTDNLIKLNICKHIHACARVFYPVITTATTQALYSTEDEVNSLFKIAETRFKETPLNDRLQTKTSLIFELLGKTSLDKDASFSVEKNLDKVIDLLNQCSNKVTEFPTHPVNQNQKIDKQINFTTSKKNSIDKRYVKKPTTNERKSILEGLANPSQEALYVHTEHDHSYCK